MELCLRKSRMIMRANPMRHCHTPSHVQVTPTTMRHTRDQWGRTATLRRSPQHQHRRSGFPANSVCARWHCACAGSITPHGRMIMYAHPMRPSVSNPHQCKSHEQQSGKRAICVDAPQPLADRRCTHIADLVAPQIQCVQGGIVPVRVHTRHMVG